ncbi:hypothetical protein AAMO2058_000805300 [Amorphochlora amoebiformis]
MGNVSSPKVSGSPKSAKLSAIQLRPEANILCAVDVDTIKSYFNKGIRSQEGLGFSLSSLLLQKVLDTSEEIADSIVNLWREDFPDDPIEDRSCDFMHLIVGALCTCKGTVYSKVHAIFSIFDTDDDRCLSRQEANMMSLVCIRGIRRLTLHPVAVEQTHQQFKYLISHISRESKTISFKDMITWVCTPSIVHVARALSTELAKHKRSRDYMIGITARYEQLAAEKKTKAADRKRVRMQRKLNYSQTKGDIKERVEKKYSKKRVKKLKELFDQFDKDETGKVPFQAVLPHIKSTAALAAHTAKNKPLTFENFLQRVFPYSNHDERKEMLKWIYFESVTKELVEKIQRVFDHLNITFCGQVMLARIIPILQKSTILKRYIGDLELFNDEVHKKVTFKELLERLFSSTHHHELKRINEFARKTPALRPEQLQELKKAFQKCDTDGSGTITFDEFRTSLIQTGFNRHEASSRFADLNQDDDKEISAIEFLRFYAESWEENTYISTISSRISRARKHRNRIVKSNKEVQQSASGGAESKIPLHLGY